MLAIWLRVRLFQSFFFPPVKNVTNIFLYRSISNQLVSTVDKTIFNIQIWHLIFVGGSEFIFSPSHQQKAVKV